MKAERQHKECASRVLQPSKGGGGHIVDNRPAEITQRKLINDVSSDINDKNIVQCFKTIQLVIDPELVAKLKEKSIMFTEEDLEFTISAPAGITTEAGVVFLEKGNTKSGYEHLKKHLHDFQDYGIVESNFADLSAMEAGRLRLRPILMTSFAFIFGVLPLMFATGAGAESRIALGTAVVFGMAMNTVLGTLFVPNFYELMETVQERWLSKVFKDSGEKGTTNSVD